MNKKRKSGRVPLAIRVIIGLCVGVIVGVVMGPSAKVFGPFGLVIITLLKTLATPLVFFAVLDAFCKTHIRPRQGAKLLGISFMNATVAVIIALVVAHLLPVGQYINLQQLGQVITPKADELKTTGLPELSGTALLQTLVPNNVVDPFIHNNVIAVVFMSVLLGMALRFFRNQGQFTAEMDTIEKVVEGGLRLTSKVLEWIVLVVPFAVFAVVAKVVGTTGFQAFAALAFFVALVVLGLFLHVVVYYSMLLALWARKSPIDFFKQGSEALVTAFGTGSSLATLPVTLPTLQDKMKISPASSRLAACVGTNLNHDGIILYEAVAAVFVAQLQGVHVTLSQQVLISVTSVLAAVGIAGVPDAGLITLSLVLGSVGLPLEAVPFLLPVDWFIGRLRATANVTSDMTVATLLDR